MHEDAPSTAAPDDQHQTDGSRSTERDDLAQRILDAVRPLGPGIRDAGDPPAACPPHGPRSRASDAVRSSRACRNRSHPSWARTRHSRCCVSTGSSDGGSVAQQRWSRAGDADRHDPSLARRNGQIASSQSSPVITTSASRQAHRRPRPHHGQTRPRTDPLRADPSSGIERASGRWTWPPSYGAIAAAQRTRPGQRKNPGDGLFSREATLSVSSALESLTSVFGMGTGVASPLESPGFCACVHATGCTTRTHPHT